MLVFFHSFEHFLLNQNYQSFNILYYNVEPDYWKARSPLLDYGGSVAPLAAPPPPRSYYTGANLYGQTLAIQILAIKPQKTDSTKRI